MSFTSSLLPALLAALGVAACRTPEGPSTSTSGTLVVLAKSDATATLLDASSGALVATLPTGAGPHEVACRKHLAVVADYGARDAGHTLTVFDTEAASHFRTIDLGEHRRPHGIVFVDDTHVLVTVEDSKAVLRVDVTSGAVERVYATAQDTSHMLVVAPDGKRAFVANMFSDSVTVLDLASGAVLAQIPVPGGPEALDVTPDGAEVWVGQRSLDALTVIDTRSLATVATLPCAKFPIRVKFTPDGRHALVSCAASGDIAVFDVATRTLARRVAVDVSGATRSFEGVPQPIGIVIRPDGRRAWVAVSNADVVNVLDLERWSVIAVIATGREPDGLGWSAH